MKRKNIVFVLLFVCIPAWIIPFILRKINPPSEYVDAMGCVEILPGEPVNQYKAQA